MVESQRGRDPCHIAAPATNRGQFYEGLYREQRSTEPRLIARWQYYAYWSRVGQGNFIILVILVGSRCGEPLHFLSTSATISTVV